MRKIFIVFSIIFGVIGSVFTVLPLGTLALAIVLPAIIFSFLSVLLSKDKPQKLPKLLLLFSFTLFLAVLSKEVFTKDKVIEDKNFIQEKEKSLQEAKHDLEEIEGLQ